MSYIPIKVVIITKMDIIKAVLGWILLFVRYVFVNIIVGGIADQYLFHPLEAGRLWLMGYEENVGGQGGEGCAGDRGDSGGEGDGARAGAGQI